MTASGFQVGNAEGQKREIASRLSSQTPDDHGDGGKGLQSGILVLDEIGNEGGSVKQEGVVVRCAGFSSWPAALGKGFSPARAIMRTANDFIALWPPANSRACEQANEEGIIDPRARARATTTSRGAPMARAINPHSSF